jgi:hypothetical protein
VGQKVDVYNGATMIGGAAVDKQVFTTEKPVIDLIAALSAKDKMDAVVVVANSWTTAHHRLVSWNANNDLQLSPPGKWPFTNFGLAQRFFIENIASALDQEGEWYLDSAKKISYLARNKDVGKNIKFNVPQVAKIIDIKGSSIKKISHLQFKGIVFQYAGFALPAEGFTDSQAATKVGEAISISYADNISFSDCEVSHVGGYAFGLNTKAKNVSIQSCEIFDTGAGAIKVGSTDTADYAADATGYLNFSNNLIHATGFEFPGAPAVVILKSSNNLIADNTIGDTTYSGISVGWQWNNAEPSTAANNKIYRNFLYDIGQSSMTDMGGIYTLGNSPGTEIKGNVIKNVRGFLPDGAGAWGIYNDQGSSNILVEGNVIVGTDAGSYFGHKQMINNIVRNNALASMSTEARFAGVEIETADGDISPTGKSVEFNNNYVFATKDPFVRMTNGEHLGQIKFSGNNVSTQYLANPLIPNACGTGCTIAKNITLNAKSWNETPDVVRDGNPVFAAGTLASFAKKKLTPVLSPSLLWKEVSADIRVPQLPFSVEAKDLPVGAPLPRFAIYPQGSTAVSVQNVGGNKCFAFKDSASMLNSYEPFGQAAVAFYSGIAKEHFKLSWIPTET